MGNMALSQKDFDAAEGYFLRQLEIDQKSFDAHTNLGDLYLKRSEYESAINEYKTAIQLDSEHSQVDPYLCLATILATLSRLEEAYEWLYRLSFEVKKIPEFDADIFNKLYYAITYNINDSLSINDLDSLILQIETKYDVSITTQLVVNPDAPLMPFRKTGDKTYEIDYDLDSNDKHYEVLTSLILLDNHLGGEHFDFHHFLMATDKGKEQFAAMTRNTMATDSPLSMADLVDYMVVDLRTTLIRIYTDEVIYNTPEFKKYRPIQWLGMGNAITLSYNYIRKLERIHAPRIVINVHMVLLYLKACQLYEYFKASDKRIDFQSERNEHKMGRAFYRGHMDIKDSAKRRDWAVFYRSFVNQICPPLRYYITLEEI
jgi:tetratricopeptide (TPR) repeat protein